MELSALHFKFTAIVGCFPVGFLSLVFALFSWFSWIKHNKYVDWHSVQGTIVFSGVAKRIEVRPGLHSYVSGKYVQTIEYAYRVNGKEYSNDKFRLRGEFTVALTKEGAREAHLKYKVNSPITVYYDPLNPENSVLETNYTPEYFFLLKMGLLSLAIGETLWLLATHLNFP